MSFQPDLDAYFTRIQYDGPRRPTRQVLDAVIRAHVTTVPFENLDVLLGRPIELEPAKIESKIVGSRRGGYCFEQNGYFLEVLKALGFEARPISARVRIGRARDFTPARTHMLIRVELDGEALLADVGVGALSLTCALRLDTDEEQATPHEPRRLIREGNWSSQLRDPRALIFHQVRFDDRWEDVAEFTLEEMPEIDRQVANWFTSTHPQSHFKSRLIVARATHSGRITIADDLLTQRGPDGVGIKQKLTSEEDLEEALAEHFGIRLEGARAPMPPYS